MEEDWKAGLVPVQQQPVAQAAPIQAEEEDWKAGLVPAKMSATDQAIDIGKGVLGGIPKIGSTLISGASIIGGGLAHAVGANEVGDTIFRDMDRMNQSIDQFLEEKNLQPKGTAGEIARGLTQIGPALTNPASGMAMAAGMTQDQLKSLNQQGVDPETAKNAARIQSVANVVLGRLGGAGPVASYLKEAGINVGTGALANWLTEMFLKSEGYKDAAKEYDPLAAENWMTDLLASMIGVKLAKSKGPRAKAESQADIDAKLSEELKTAKPEPSDGETPTPVREPEQLRLPLDETDPNIVPKDFEQVPLRPEFNLELQDGPPADLQMDLLPKDQYPVPDGGVRNQYPIPQTSDAGPVLPKMRTAQGMDESVPTIDFPLRQEVLDSEGGRNMTDFAADQVQQMRDLVAKKWAAVQKQAEFLTDFEGSKESRAQEHDLLRKLTDELDTLQQQLGAMEQGVQEAYKGFGINEPKDASGRPIYDRLKPGRGIAPKHTVDPRFVNAMKRKGQGGFVNPGIFRGIGQTFQKQLDNGFSLRAKVVGSKKEPMLRIDVMQGNKAVGGGAVFRPADLTSLQDTHLVGQAGLPEKYRGLGLSEEVYRYAAELGNDIKPGQGQTKAGQGMWKNFEKTGLSEGKTIYAFPKVKDEPTKVAAVRALQEAIDNLPSAPVREIPRRVGEINNAWNKQQGKIDPEVFKEGMKRFTHALSRLTDKGWVKAKFPADKYETNSDGTPLVMLHGTNRDFSGDVILNDQGIHLGFVVPAHLIRAPGDMFTRPKKSFTDVRYEEERIKSSLAADPNPDAPLNVRASKFTKNIKGMGYNLRPHVLKKGTYPYLNKDIGVWKPVNVMADFKADWDNWARENGKEPMSLERKRWYANAIDQAERESNSFTTGYDKMNSLFSQFLKEHGIDGFFYKNAGESLKKTTTSSDGHRKLMVKIRERNDKFWSTHGIDGIPPPAPLQHPISFVTWDKNNIESLYVDRPVDQAALAKWAKATKQGGAINLDEITAGVSKMVEAVRGVMKNPSLSMAEEATPDHQRAAAAKVPGLSALKNYIPKDIDPKLIVEKIKQMGDIKNSYHALIGSKEMIASIKNHPAIYWIASRFTNARKRSDLYHREFLQPLEEKVLKLTQDKRGARLAHVMKQEMFAHKRLDDEALRRIGLDDRDIDIYNQLRTEFDKALERLNIYFKSVNEKPLTRHEAYLSSRWFGDWKTPVYDKKGKLIWYIAESSKAKAEHALKYLEKNYPELDISKSRVRYQKDFFFTEDSMILSTYRDMVRMLGKNDPAVRAMEQYYEQKTEGEGETLLGHNKHFEPKAGIRGFLGDRPWVNEGRNSRDLLKSQLAYLRNTHTWVELQKAVDDANSIIGNKEVQEVAPNLVELLQDLKKNEMGAATYRGISSLERLASKGLSYATSGLNKLFPPIRHVSTDLASINTGMGWAKSYFYLTKLGMYNIPFAMMSLIQPVFTIPHHFQLTEQGYSHNMLKTWVDVMGGTAGAAKAFITQDMGWLSGIQQEAYKYMVANSIGDLNQYSEAHSIGMPQWAEKVKELGGKSMTESERFARTMAFMGYVSHLDQSGKFKGRQMEMFQKAEELTNKSMANYRHTERAGMFNKTGFVGSAAATLNTFKVNQWNQMYDFAKYAKRTRDYKPIATMLMTQWMLAGAIGMYGIDELEDMWSLMKLALVELGVADKELLAFSPKKAFADNLYEWAAFGVVSSVHNRNWTGRMSAGNVVDWSFTGMFPFVSDYAKQISAMAIALKDLAMGKNYEESGERAIHALLPSSMKSWYEMNSNTMVDEEGNPYPTTKDPRQLQYRRSEFDREVKDQPLFGMPSLDEGKAKTLEYQTKQYEGNVKRLQQVLSEEFEAAIRTGDYDQAAEVAIKYHENDGDIKNLVRQIDDDLMKTMFTEDEWLAIKASGEQGIKRLIRRMEFKNVR